MIFLTYSAFFSFFFRPSWLRLAAAPLMHKEMYAGGGGEGGGGGGRRVREAGEEEGERDAKPKMRSARLDWAD